MRNGSIVIAIVTGLVACAPVTYQRQGWATVSLDQAKAECELEAKKVEASADWRRCALCAATDVAETRSACIKAKGYYPTR
jgi:hypothetical protein